MVIEVSVFLSIWIVLWENLDGRFSNQIRMIFIYIYIYINEESFTISTPSDFLETEQLQAITMRLTSFNINNYKLHRNLIFVTNCKSAVFSIR